MVDDEIEFDILTASVAVVRCKMLLPSIYLATLNVQGWNWSRLDPWNTDKAAELVSLARQHDWDVLALFDLHTCAGEIEIWENNSRTARRVQRDVFQVIVAMEEFILVAGQRSGFLLSLAAAEAWRDSGCDKELSDDGRLLRLNINILDQRYDFVSGYAPTGDTRGRRDFFESASAFVSSARPNALQLWLGDWNGHVGRLSTAPSTVQGRFGLSTPTTAAGRELLQWLEESTPSLQVADSYSRIGHPGTWRLVRDIPGRAPDWHWYELDLFLCRPNDQYSVSSLENNCLFQRSFCQVLSPLVGSWQADGVRASALTYKGQQGPQKTIETECYERTFSRGNDHERSVSRGDRTISSGVGADTFLGRCGLYLHLRTRTYCGSRL